MFKKPDSAPEEPQPSEMRCGGTAEERIKRGVKNHPAAVTDGRERVDGAESILAPTCREILGYSKLSGL
jgi:hypothetical protein